MPPHRPITDECPACGRPVPPIAARIYPEGRVVICRERAIPLTEQQTILLKMLLDEAPRPVHRDRLMLAIWADQELADPWGQLRNLIHKTRGKLQGFLQIVRMQEFYVIR